MAKVIMKMDQIGTGVAVRTAMLLEAVVNLLPSGSREHERGSWLTSGTALVVVLPQLRLHLLVSRK